MSAVIVHTRDHKRYVVSQEGGNARTVSKAIKDGHLVACEHRDWVSGRTDRFDVIFNPDNVVSVTES